MNNGNMAEFPGDLLRAAYGPTSDCPPPETFLADEWIALPEQRQEELANHAATCPACAAERDLAAAFDEDGFDTSHGAEDLDIVRSRIQSPAQIDVPPDNVVPLSRRRFWTPVVGVAAAVFLGVALVPILKTGIVGAPAIQSPGAGTTVRSARIEILYPVGEVEEAPTELGWVGAENATRYEITVRRVDGRPIWQTVSHEAAIEIPNEIRALLQPAVAYTWDVSAWNRNGARLAWSDEVRFKLALQPRNSGIR